MKHILIKKINDTFSDKIIINSSDFKYTITCSYIKNGSSTIYSRSSMPDHNHGWALFWLDHYIKDGYTKIF